MTADLLADLPPAAQAEARALLAQHTDWLGALVEVRTAPDVDGLRVTLIGEGGAVEFVADGK